MRKQIARERADTIYRQQEAKEQMLAGLLVLLSIAIVVGTAIFIVSG